MKNDILDILWLLGKSLKALLFFRFAEAREWMFFVYLHMAYEHERIKDEDDPVSNSH